MKFCRGRRTPKYFLWVFAIAAGLFGYRLFESFEKKGCDVLKDPSVKHRTTPYQTATTTEIMSPKTTIILVKLPDHELFLYTALLSNSSSETTWDRLAITGWENKETKNKHFVCCVKSKSGLIRQTSKAARARDVRYLAKLGPLQYVCDISWRYNSSDPPTAATISLKFGQKEVNGGCLVEESRFIPIEYVYNHPTEIAAISKIIYGNVSLPDLIAWLEIHRSLGMDKVVFYSYRLGHNVSRVLQYYQKHKLVEVIPVFFPNPAYRTANFSSLILTYDYWVDEEIALIDGQERLRGYNYVVVFDIDEYIVPSGQRTWKTLTDEVTKSYSKAAGFVFFTLLYTTSWGVSSNSSYLQIGRYLNRTGCTRDRPKYIFIPARATEAGLHPHTFAPKPGFHISTVPENLAALSHYRSCRERYDLTSTKCFGFKRHFDDSIYKRFAYMEDEVKRLSRKILE